MEYYNIYVGAKRPASALMGFLEKGSGQTITKGEVIEIPLEVGAHGFPNYSKVWGKRVIMDQDKKVVQTNGIVNIEDPRYKGDIQFLKYGDKDGYFIEVRYLDTCSTLDMQFQINRLKLIIRGDEDKWYIKLPPGENRISPVEKPMFVEFLKVHHCNRNSKSKSPNATLVIYEEIGEDTMDMTGIKVRESKGDAIFIVKNAALKTGQIKNLLKVIGDIPEGIGRPIDNRASEQEVYNSILELADMNPQFLLDRIENFKRGISDLFIKATSFNIMDLAKHGQIALEVNGKKEILLDKVPGNGNQEKILQWLFENYLNEDNFAALARLKDVCDKIK